MAKVEIEIDDEILEQIDKAGFVATRLGKSNSRVLSWSAFDTGPIETDMATMNCLIIERKPDDSIPFPDWVPQKWQWVAVDKNGDVFLYEQEPSPVYISIWANENGKLDLCAFGFDTSWVPAMPSGDWKKAKWRRRK